MQYSKQICDSSDLKSHWTTCFARFKKNKQTNYPLDDCYDFNDLFSSQQATLYNICIINVCTTWSLQRTDCTTKTQGESQPINACDSSTHNIKTPSASFLAAGWLVNVACSDSHTVTWLSHISDSDYTYMHNIISIKIRIRQYSK